MTQVRIACGPDAGHEDADILLLPGRAALVTASRTLLVADLHLGKAAAFRSAGIPVPEGSAQADLARLERLVHTSATRRVVVLGDLFHAKGGCTPAVYAEFAEVRGRLSGVEVLLVLGNHDRALGPLPAGLGIDACLTHLDEPPFHFVHEPATAAVARGLFTVGGHLHPTVAVTSPSGDRLADRCFAAHPALLVLPAFGSFTGGHRVEPTDGMRLWIARDDGVVEVTRLVAPGRRR